MQQLAVRPTYIKERSGAKERRWLWPVLILAVALATFLPTLGLTGIIDPSDGFFSESAREMFESGNYIVPRLNYEAYNNKPILTHWFICSAYQLFGVSEFSSRIPSALCAILLCVGTYLFARRFLPRRVAVLSGFILMSSMLFSAVGRVSLVDMPLALWINLTVFSLFVGLEQKNNRFITIGLIALGLSFLTKGPIAFLIAGGTFLLYFLATATSLSPRAVATQFLKLQPLKALLIAAAINLPWFIAVGIATHGAFITDFFFTENVMRAMGKIQMNHAQPPYYYLELFLGGFFPWTLLLFAGTPAILKWWKLRTTDSPRIRLLAFCAAAALTVLCGFTALKGKLPTYIVPMFPTVAILTAAALDAMARIPKRRALLWTGPTLIAAAVAMFGYVLLKQDIRGGMRLCMMIFAGATVYTFTGYSVLLAMRKSRLALQQFTISWVAICALLVPYMFKLFYNTHQRSYASLVDQAAMLKLPMIEIVNESPSAPFYLHKHVPSIQNYFDFAYILGLTPGNKLILCPDKYEHLPKQAPFHQLISKRQQYCLYLVADPHRKLLNEYFDKVNNAKVAHDIDPDFPDADKIITTPSRGMFLN